MRARLWPVLLAVAALIGARTVAADPVGRYVYLTPIGGFTIYDSKLAYPDGQALADNAYVGGRLGYRWSDLWALELASGVSPTHEDVDGGKNVTFFHASGNLVMTPWSKPLGGPYLFVGFGEGRLSSTGATTLKQGLLEAGGGLRIWLTDALGLRLEAREARWVRKDAPDGAPGIDYVTLSGGLTFALGAKGRDTDGDGVPDRRDRCPDTPKGAIVDSRGCPIDTDGDGVYDGLDKCPDTPKGCTVDKNGCPSDSDGDGVCDGIDKCEGTPKGCTVDASGCPGDQDNDGVCDGLDKCPDTPKGCNVDERGCPRDSDGDGVCDGLDQCPDTPAGLKVDDKGCPIELIQRETELMDTGKIRLQNINFDTGKSTLKPDSYPTLDVVGTLLSEWPTLRIEIAGHTDSEGGAAINRKLSLARAQAVLAYLVGKYPQIGASRFVVKGYGEDRPIATNKTPEGRALNRRVEFTVLNKDVLQKEVEQRRLLKKGEPAPADTTTKAPADTTGGH